MSASERVRRRFRVDSLAVEHDGTLEISGGPLRHLAVLRAAAGDTVFLFDGNGREVEGELIEVVGAAIDDVRYAFKPCWY